jgi:hypothetical protein
MSTKVFLSHNSQDKDAARRIAVDLRARGIEVSFDAFEMRVGDSLIEKIQQGISESGYLAVLLSPHSVASPWVTKELNTVLMQDITAKSIKVLPLLYRDCEVPLFLKEKLYADFRSSYEGGLNELLRVFSKEGLRRTVFIGPGTFLHRREAKLAAIDYGYYIDVYPVTNEDFWRFMRDTDYVEPKYLTQRTSLSTSERMYPVVMVNVPDAQAYCAWRSNVEQRTVRLPTEMEWEKAARGNDGRTFPWGNDATKYWFCNCIECNDCERQGARRPTPVDEFPHNVSPYGCCDMAGNVMEWTSSEYHKGPGAGNEVRGGSWGNSLDDARCYAAMPHFRDDRSSYVGFRCVTEI